jgi:UDPglucose--hexose-1-phosphate uridylyltransferase
LRPFDAETDSHRRYNPLTGQFVLVSPHRSQRPWQGQTENAPRERRAEYDPGCYLCPGNRRARSDVNPSYQGTFVFDNDFSALLPDVADVSASRPEASMAGALDASTPRGEISPSDPLLHLEPVRGVCRVICFSPRHDLSLAEMAPAEIGGVIETWAAETAALGSRYQWVQVFENKGAVMGCSNPHPHGQIWASSSLPNEAQAEDLQQRIYLTQHGVPLLVDYERRERELDIRVVHTSPHFTAVVPFWAVWPFEMVILPRRPIARLPELTTLERADLAAFLAVILGAYDRLFDVSFPYSMGWHGAPFDDVDGAPGSHQHWQLHGHIYPPLLRSAAVKKFMVGYEMLAEPQRDLTPEQAAYRLRHLVKVS